MDPKTQKLFAVDAPNALDPGFFFTPGDDGTYHIEMCQGEHDAGLVDPGAWEPLYTPIYGYGDGETCTWPGKTFEVESFTDTHVKWNNKLPLGEKYLITSLQGKPVLDTSLHWAYSLPGYEHYTIKHEGTPVVVHNHGGHTDFEWDGGPEQFFSPHFEITGPDWEGKVYTYDNSQEATTSWYHGTYSSCRLLSVPSSSNIMVFNTNNDSSFLNRPYSWYHSSQRLRRHGWILYPS